MQRASDEVKRAGVSQSETRSLLDSNPIPAHRHALACLLELGKQTCMHEATQTQCRVSVELEGAHALRCSSETFLSRATLFGAQKGATATGKADPKAWAGVNPATVSLHVCDCMHSIAISSSDDSSS